MRELIFGHAIRNASEHGEADPKAVLSKVLGERPELRSMAKEVLKEVEEVVKEVNSLSKEDIIKEAETFAIEKGVKAQKGLENLPSAEKGKVKLRFAPNPSGPLHIGHARAAVLNDEYAKMYEGELILRFEDTDPKRVDVKAYDLIREDLTWLDVKVDREILQSERLDLYYNHAKALFQKRAVYVCTCPQEDFKKLREAGKPCACRGEKTAPEYFEKMFDEYSEGEAVLRLKTDLAHKNTSFRDFPIMRIVDAPHPIAGDKKVYPLMNFSVAIDDHELDLTHILRGKDHILNTHKQAFIFDYFGWEPPKYVHYGLLKIEGVMLSTSEIKSGIKTGEYSGWNDVRLGTITALARRGMQSGAVRRVMLDVGIKPTDISFSWKNLYAYNKELIDSVADRYSFVENPHKLKIVNPHKLKIVNPPAMMAKNRLHPTMDRGFRTTALKSGEQEVLLRDHDFEKMKPGQIIRLMGAYNVEITSMDERAEAVFQSLTLEEARKRKAMLINWVNPKDAIDVLVMFADKTVHGVGEAALKDIKVGDVVQFERFGFVRIDEKNEKLTAVFAHK
jgi:glutamyl-tRNA synthetase